MNSKIKNNEENNNIIEEQNKQMKLQLSQNDIK